MSRFVRPETFLVGYTSVDEAALQDYLTRTDQMEFLEDYRNAREDGTSPAECLCSFYAKACYASLTARKNKNIKSVRDVGSNIRATFTAGHSSVFEHASFNFMVTNCSRVLTHEACRHRSGTAFSQTSGRFVRGDSIDFVADPILEPVASEGEKLLGEIEIRYGCMCDVMGLNGREGLRRVSNGEMTDDQIHRWATETLGLVDIDNPPFDYKKKVTSALRRYLPNGQANELGFTLNIRSLRHFVMLRTAAGAEWEIRVVANQIYDLVKAKFPLVFCGARERIADGQREVYGMKMQPWEKADES